MKKQVNFLDAPIPNWWSRNTGFCYGIQRIESLRERDPEVDALITELKQKLGEEFVGRTEIVESPAEFAGISQAFVDQLADVVATRVCAYLEKRIHSSEQLNASPKNKL